MITRVSVKNFKRFKNETLFDFKPQGLTFLAGGNNSGKSTVLQALAVWEFCRTVVELERGEKALKSGANTSGVGLSAEDFTPLALPDLKHLWNNLKVQGDGPYNLKIICHWKNSVDGAVMPEHSLGFAMSLGQDRLYVKPCQSTVSNIVDIPRMAYLPPFAGIQPKEERMSTARQKRLVGQGLAGGVLRNILYDLWSRNEQGLSDMRNPAGRIPRSERAEFLKTDPWTRLSEVLAIVFKVGLTVDKFNDLYHTAIRVGLFEGKLVNRRFEKNQGFTSRDIMVEGSGFLQWLSVYALAVDPNIHVLLLDEPDAHLHPSLQNHLVFRLNELAVQNRKQALIATHSTTVLSEVDYRSIWRMEAGKYLDWKDDLIPLFEGLGSSYTPRINELQRYKRVFFYEGPTDLAILQIWAAKLRHRWPQNLVLWEYTKDRHRREVLFHNLRSFVKDLEGIGLQDRDDDPEGKVKPDLTFSDMQPVREGLRLRMWKRRNLENYLLVPEAIARATGRPLQEVNTFLQTNWGITINANYRLHNCDLPLISLDGKKILSGKVNSIFTEYGITDRQVAEAMEPGEIADDVKTLLNQIQVLCRP